MAPSAEYLMHGNHLINGETITDADIVRGLRLLLEKNSESETRFIKMLGHRLIAASYNARLPELCGTLVL
jgi:hypothetical protein